MFSCRAEAGRLLGEAVRELALPDPLVLGIPRGGVVVGFHTARELGGDLDVVVARKLGAPWNPELAIGAIMEGGETYLNRSIISGLGVGEKYVAEEKEYQMAELQARTEKYRKARAFVPREGRNLIVVDDGVATGATMMATLQGLRAGNPASLWCALPVGPRDTIEALADIADEVVCLTCPPFFQAVGQFYQQFGQTSDKEVLELLRQCATP